MRMTRRDLLNKMGAAALALPLTGITAGKAEAKSGSRANAMILLWMNGGMSHLDTFDPKPTADRAIRGPFQARDTEVSGIQINAHLPRIAQQIRHIALLRGVSHGEGGHERAHDYLLTGRRPVATHIFPTFAETFAPNAHTALQSDDFTADCVRAGQLIENGTRCVTVTLDGWDTHEDHFPRLRNHLLPALDSGFSTLITRLHERGVLDSTLVVCLSEFGRSPVINRNGRPGREHWPAAFAVAMAGGGIRGGQVIGATDAEGREPLEKAITPEDIAAAIDHHFRREPGFRPKPDAHQNKDLPGSSGQVLHRLF